MRRTSRIAIAALAAAALVLPLSACAGSGSSGSGDGTVELSFFHRWPNEPKHSYYADVVAEFEKENPNITVKVENVLNDAYKDKIKVVAGSANAPDVMFTWSGSFAGELVKSDALMDLGPWLKEDKQFADSFYPSQLTPVPGGRHPVRPARGHAVQAVLLQQGRVRQARPAAAEDLGRVHDRAQDDQEVGGRRPSSTAPRSSGPSRTTSER